MDKDKIYDYASVCAGIEAATVAWEGMGWVPAWYSQFDPENNYDKGKDFASKVLESHYPNVPNLGDMLKLTDQPIYNERKFNVLVGGTPCQAFSIAGLRNGLRDERSNLALEFVRILVEKRPPWFVWENVPGVLTSGASGEATDDDGDETDDTTTSDFACILSAFTGRDIAAQDFEKAGAIEGEFYSIAWRVFDSQYFGVPQRRRRLFIVGHFGKDWRPPVAVLFERESMRRDFTPGKGKRKGPTQKTGGGIGQDCTGYRMTGFGEYADDNAASNLKKRDYKDAKDLVVMPIILDPASFNQGTNALFVPKIEQNETCPTLIKRGPHAVYFNPIVLNDQGGAYMDVNEEGLVGTLRKQTHGHEPIVCYDPIAFKERGGKYGGGKGFLGSDQKAFSITKNDPQRVISGPLVRRLTPLECERLQGFPDNYTNIQGAKDSDRYAVLGNSMTTHVMGFIGKRIDIVDKSLKMIS